MKNFIEAGHTLDWTNSTTADVSSGDLVVVGDLVGVASGNIAVGGEGVLFTSGVYELPKDTTEIAQGKTAYVSSGKVTATTGTPVAGKAWKLAAKTDATCWVRLGS